MRSIAIQEETNIYLRVCRKWISHFNHNVQRGIENLYHSPIFDILRISIIYGLFDEVCHMMSGVTVYSKQQWKQLIWSRAWQVEKDNWCFTITITLT